MRSVRKNCFLISNILIYSQSFLYFYIRIRGCELQKDIGGNPVIEINFIDVTREADKPHEQSKVTQLASEGKKKNPDFLNWGELYRRF